MFDYISQPFELKFHIKAGMLIPKIMLKLFLKNSIPKMKMSRKRLFRSLKMVKNHHIRVQILSKSLDFQGHFVSIKAKNETKSVAFRAKSNLQASPDHRQTKVQKAQNAFFGPKNWQITGTKLVKS